MLREDASDKRMRCCRAKSRRSACWQKNIVDAGAPLRARSVSSRIFSAYHVMLHVKNMSWKDVEVVKALLEFVIVAPERPNYLRCDYTDSARRDGPCFFDLIKTHSESVISRNQDTVSLHGRSFHLRMPSQKRGPQVVAHSHESDLFHRDTNRSASREFISIPTCFQFRASRRSHVLSLCCPTVQRRGVCYDRPGKREMVESESPRASDRLFELGKVKCF